MFPAHDFAADWIDEKNGNLQSGIGHNLEKEIYLLSSHLPVVGHLFLLGWVNFSLFFCSEFSDIDIFTRRMSTERMFSFMFLLYQILSLHKERNFLWYACTC